MPIHQAQGSDSGHRHDMSDRHAAKRSQHRSHQTLTAQKKAVNDEHPKKTVCHFIFNLQGSLFFMTPALHPPTRQNNKYDGGKAIISQDLNIPSEKK